jgi:hypothetical protein
MIKKSAGRNQGRGKGNKNRDKRNQEVQGPRTRSKTAALTTPLTSSVKLTDTPVSKTPSVDSVRLYGRLKQFLSTNPQRLEQHVLDTGSVVSGMRRSCSVPCLTTVQSRVNLLEMLFPNPGQTVNNSRENVATPAGVKTPPVQTAVSTLDISALEALFSKFTAGIADACLSMTKPILAAVQSVLVTQNQLVYRVEGSNNQIQATL